MWARLLRLAGWAAYAGLALVLFVFSGYFAFNSFVRSGVTTVPELVGIAEADAEAVLSDSGLALRASEQGRRYDEEVPADHVLRQAPSAGSIVKRGSGVSVVISQGPERVDVPAVTGKALPAAQVELGAAGLALGGTAGVYSARGLPGTVVEQSPPAGSRVAKDASVDLLLCLDGRAETFLMPDLVYRDHERVKQYFERRGFRVGSVKFEAYEGIAPGVVLRQYPLPGHPLRKRDVISLVVATSELRGS